MRINYLSNFVSFLNEIRSRAASQRFKGRILLAGVLWGLVVWNFILVGISERVVNSVTVINLHFLHVQDQFSPLSFVILVRSFPHALCMWQRIIGLLQSEFRKWPSHWLSMKSCWSTAQWELWSPWRHYPGVCHLILFDPNELMSSV
jgi:hypothetical protein